MDLEKLRSGLTGTLGCSAGRDAKPCTQAGGALQWDPLGTELCGKLWECKGQRAGPEPAACLAAGEAASAWALQTGTWPGDQGEGLSSPTQHAYMQGPVLDPAVQEEHQKPGMSSVEDCLKLWYLQWKWKTLWRTLAWILWPGWMSLQRPYEL